MSLKAKLEAVIYAAEEPVTLAQLAVLFSEEVLQEVEARAAARENSPGAEPPAGEAEGLDFGSVDSVQPVPQTEEGAQIQVAGAEAEGKPADAGSEGVSPEEEEKRAARRRDRQVRSELEAVISELMEECASDDRGMEIREVAGGYRMSTKPEYHDTIRAFVKSMKPPLKLSLPALETLAVVAYKQPVTAPEVGEIRGVDSGGVLGSLLSRKLIATAGRKQVIGRPILYKTTKEFLMRFGLKDLADLPSMEEFEKMAAELAEADAPEPAAQTPELQQEATVDDTSESSATDPSSANDEITAEPEHAEAEPVAEAESATEPAEAVPDKSGEMAAEDSPHARAEELKEDGEGAEPSGEAAGNTVDESSGGEPFPAE